MFQLIKTDDLIDTSELLSVRTEIVGSDVSLGPPRL